MLVMSGMVKRKVSGVVRAATRTAGLFRRAEDGSLVIFALMLFVLMTMMGGLAIDLMKYEQTRTTLQNTLDRSTLAAASLTQTLDPDNVVHDYFDKAGMSQFLTGVTVNEGINFREVIASATADTKPYFLHMLGVNGFDAPSNSAAEQRITNVEIALVLDVSGSMNSNNRLTNLKTAASEFVATVLNSDAENRISIALVPFNGQVNLGTTLRAKYTTTDNPGVTDVNCVDLPTSVYSSFGMSRTLPMPMTAHADTFTGTAGTASSATSPTNTAVVTPTNSDALPSAANRWCPPMPGNIVRLPSYSITQLQGYINGLTGIGATSINAGMKWGMSLIDPAARPMFNEFIASNDVPSYFTGRPYDFADEDSMKIIVLMTDGSHFAEERVNAGFRTGLSPIYRSTGDGNYSVFHAGYAGANKYWVPHRNEWRLDAWNSGAGVVQQTWPQVWGNLKMSYVAWHLYARGLGSSNTLRQASYNSTIAAFRSQTPIGTMDTQLQTACSLAKTNGVIVYGIAFEAPSGGAVQIANCASSSSHYFGATGLQINTAFRAIASNISQLRLTQ